MATEVNRYSGQTVAHTVSTHGHAADPPNAGSSIGMLIVVFLIYFAPALIASQPRHRNRGAIAMLNLLLGWTLLGWVIAIVWAMTENTEPKPI